MKRNTFGRVAILLFGLLFMIAGCSSLDKARSLHNQGKDGEALEMAAKYLKDDDENVRLAAIKLVGDIGGDEAGELLLPLLDDEVVEVKNAAIKTIGQLKYVPASKKLVAMSLGNQGETLEEIAGAIRSIGSPAIDLLIKTYNSAKNTVERDQYKKVMFIVGPSVAEGVAKTMAGKSFFDNQANFELLVAFKNPLVATWMLNEIENEEVADMVVEGLVKLGNKAVIPVLDRLSGLIGRPGNVEVKERLIRALGDLKDKRALSVLETMTKDDNERVVNASETALRKIRGF